MKINTLKLLDFNGTEGYYFKKDFKPEMGLALSLDQEFIGNYLVEKYGGRVYYIRNKGLGPDYFMWKIHGKKADEIHEKVKISDSGW